MNKPYNRLVRLLALTAASALSLTSCGFIVINRPGSEVSVTQTEETETSDPVTQTSATRKPPETTAAPDPREESQKRLEALPCRDLDGAAVIIATTDTETICPSESADPVVLSRIDCKRSIEEKYNVRILPGVSDVSEMLTRAKEAIASDMYFSDLLAVPQSSLGSFAAAGLLANMRSLPFTDYDSRYYYPSLTNEALYGTTLCGVFGSANVNPEYLSCVYVNTDLIRSLGLENPYELVYSGNWTWEKLYELSNASGVINGHGIEADRADYLDLLVSSSGLSYVSHEFGEVPVITYMDDFRASGIVDRLYHLLFDGGYVETSEGIRSLFVTDDLLFMTDRMYVTTWLINNRSQWGILPMPKADESQSDYYSPLAPEAPVFCALANTPNYETSGLILEAMNAAAFDYVLDTYRNERINRCLRDSDSIHMMDRILAGATTDFSLLFASGTQNLAAATCEAVSRAVTSTSSLDVIYNQKAAAAQKELNAMKIY